MSAIKQAVNLDFVLGPDLDLAANAVNGVSSLGQTSVNQNAGKMKSDSNATEDSDSAYSLSSVSTVIICVVNFTSAASILILNNLVINQKATYKFFVTRDQAMLLSLPSNKNLMEFIMFESFITAWAVLSQYRALMTLSALTSMLAFFMMHTEFYLTEEIRQKDFHWIRLLLRPMLLIRFGSIFGYWFKR